MASLLEVRKLCKYYPKRKGIFHGGEYIKAVDDISFSINKGETLGLVGESGCGKSTAARTILRLTEPTSGEALFKGRNIFTLKESELRSLRPLIQPVFQDPYSSLDPRMQTIKIVSEAVIEHGIKGKSEVQDYITDILELCGLSGEYLERYPRELSGGERQRLAIARAMALRPEIIIADEPVAALDVSIQAQIINLLKQLEEERGLSYLFISHDLSVVRYISDTVAVMYLGAIVELAGKQELFENPLHPYTKALLSSAPGSGVRKLLLKGEIPSASAIPSGCRFHTRCPYATRECIEETPQYKEYGKGHFCACHLLNQSP